MSKIRIYELARELGVDNKIVLNKANELGMQGKSSHSNSLDADEADQIRRALIRQAMGAQSASPAARSEVVTTRIDRVTGASDTIVESRAGNVIRRRKSAGGVSDGNAAVAANVEAKEPRPEAEALEGEIFSQEIAGGDGSAEISSDGEAQPVAESVAESTLEQPPAAVVAASSSGTTEVVEIPAVVPAHGAVRAAEIAPAKEEPKKPTAGPRVLGKISLPVKKVAKPEPKRTFTSAAPVIVEEEEEDQGKAGKKRSKKREISSFDLIDYQGREGRGRKSGRKKSEGERQPAIETAKPKAGKRVVKIGEAITVGELARQMSLKAGDLIAKLIELGVMATINHSLDKDTAAIVAQEFEFEVESTEFDENTILKEVAADDPALLKPRPPVVTVMGHVDHGKTSLLDAIRSTSVAAREHGGITQHIGAYKVVLEDGRSVTFLDTPGHAAFTSMRARGAQVTDVAILVVAADEGAMPQTIEALNHAKAAKVPVIVAMNKMDKPETNPDRLKQQLAEHGLAPEEWGGDTMYMPVSALKKTGLRELLESVLLQVEMRELKANPDRRALGTIIESKQDRGRGTVVTILVQNGTLRVGDIFVTGAEYGRVRSMLDYNGEKLEEAGPSTPVEITGLSGVPLAGDDFFVVESEAQARQVAASRLEKKLARERALAAGPISLEEFARRANNMAAEELNVILKADVHGSMEAVREALEKLTNDKVKVRVLHTAVGGVNESDVQLAIASRAIIVGFGVRAEPRAVEIAERAGVDLRFYRIIYELIDDVKKAMAGLLAPIRKEISIGRAEVRDTFAVAKVGTVAGCHVSSGVVKRGAFVRLLRDSRVIHEGKLSSLKRFKDDVREVQSGYECGIGIEGYNDVKSGDVIDFYEIEEIAQTLD